MGERNVICGVTAALFSGFLEFLEPLKWFMLFAIILVITDLRFGIMAARKRGEVIRTSRAGRRSINKIVDYLCWILVAGGLDKAFGIPFDMPVLPAVLLLAVYAFEINSIFGNYFEAHGKHVKVNILKYFKSKMNIIEYEEEDRKDSKGD